MREASARRKTRNQLIVNAWESLFAGDFRSSVISAATALDLIGTDLVKTDRKRRKVGSSEKIEKFINKKNKPTRTARVLNLFNLGNSQLKKQSADLFSIRNALLHNSRPDASDKEATQAVETTEDFLRLAEKGLP